MSDIEYSSGDDYDDYACNELGSDPEDSSTDSESDIDGSIQDVSIDDAEEEEEELPIGLHQHKIGVFDHLKFNITSNKTIKARGVPIGLDANRDMTSETGIYSAFMGPYRDENLGQCNESECQMCGVKSSQCPGHDGYIKLHIPVIHPLYQKQLYQILCAVCHKCGTLMVSPQVQQFIIDRKIGKSKRLAYLYSEASKSRKKKGKEYCPNDECRAVQHAIVYKKAEKMFYQEVDGELHRIEAPIIYSLLKKIEKDKFTMEKMGLVGTNIDGMVIKYLYVIPNICRPPIYQDGQQRDDDLTTVYNGIIKKNYNISQLMTNNKIKGSNKNAVEPHKRIMDEYMKLVTDVETLINNKQVRGAIHTRNYKTFRGRLKGKRGRMRGNIMGKRNDFTARTPVSAGPELELDELGVPRYIAEKMTYKVTVYRGNLKLMTEMVRQGRARYVIRDGLQLYIPPKKRNTYELQMGDVVERQLQNGDWVILHRHPTLHGGSMQGVRVRIVDGYTFRVNLSVTTPLNMDFDGDEGNMYPAGDVETAAEISQLFHVNKRILSIQNGTPMVALVQDALLGSYLLTNENDIMDVERFYDCLYRARRDHTLVSLRHRARRNNFEQHMRREKTIQLLRSADEYMDFENQVKKITGDKRYSCTSDSILDANEIRYRLVYEHFQKQNPKLLASVEKQVNSMDFELCGKMLFSSLLPENFQYTRGRVVIRDGILLSGCMCKASLGRSVGSIIHLLAREFGNQVCADFITETQWLINLWMMERGFSVGYKDCIVSDYNDIDDTINEISTKIDAIYKRRGFHDAKKQKRYLEASIVAALSEAKNVGQRIATHKVTNSTNRNRFLDMIESGSKGQMINLAQIAGIVGQQFTGGGRISRNIDNGTRAICYFQRDTTDPRAYGFVGNSYLRGLTPAEFIFHMMGGREGLMDTAVKTASTGYLQRRGVKTLEDLRTMADGTVRSAEGSVISFAYGDTHMHPSIAVPVPGSKSKVFCDLYRLADNINQSYSLKKDMRVRMEEKLPPLHADLQMPVAQRKFPVSKKDKTGKKKSKDNGKKSKDKKSKDNGKKSKDNGKKSKDKTGKDKKSKDKTCKDNDKKAKKSKDNKKKDLKDRKAKK